MAGVKRPKFSLMVQHGGKTVLSTEIGGEALHACVQHLEDNEHNKDLFAVLAHCPNTRVREALGHKNNLDATTVSLLAQDPSVEVRRGVCLSPGFLAWATAETLIAFINDDADCADSIAGHIEWYKNADPEKVGLAICVHPDPSVRHTLAYNSGAPKSLIKRLCKDENQAVRDQAEWTMKWIMKVASE